MKKIFFLALATINLAASEFDSSIDWKSQYQIQERQKSYQKLLLTHECIGCNLTDLTFNICDFDPIGGYALQRALLNRVKFEEQCDDSSSKSFPFFNFTNAQLKKAQFNNRGMQGSRFDNANLEGANLSNKNFQLCSMIGTNLKGANLLGTDFNGSDLTRATWVDGTKCLDATCSGKALAVKHLYI